MFMKDQKTASHKGRSENRWLATGSLVILAMVALAAALAYTRTVMVPFVLALFIASIVSPLLDIMVIRMRFPRIIAVALTLVVVVVILGLMSLMVTSAISNIVSFARPYSENVQGLLQDTIQRYHRFRSKFESKGEAAPEDKQPPSAIEANDLSIEKARQYTGVFDLRVADGNLMFMPMEEGSDQNESGPNRPAEAAAPANPPPRSAVMMEELDINRYIQQIGQGLFNLLKSMVGKIFGVIRTTVFATIFVIFLLSGRNPRKVRSGVYADIDQKIRKYTVTKVLISAITGLLVWLALRHFGLKLASVFGILAFLLNFIPSIGSIISTFLPLPVAVAQFRGDISAIILVLAVPGLIQMIMGNGIEPKLMGEGLNLHPITILLALSFWGLLWGIVGMFLAAPMTAVIRIILMQFESLEPLGRLLAGELPLEKTQA